MQHNKNNGGTDSQNGKADLNEAAGAAGLSMVVDGAVGGVVFAVKAADQGSDGNDQRQRVANARQMGTRSVKPRIIEIRPKILPVSRVAEASTDSLEISELLVSQFS